MKNSIKCYEKNGVYICKLDKKNINHFDCKPSIKSLHGGLSVQGYGLNFGYTKPVVICITKGRKIKKEI